jgi:hypothetical protein
VVKRAPGLRVVVETMLGSVPAVLNVCAVLLLLFLIAAIFVVGYLKVSSNDVAHRIASLND